MSILIQTGDLVLIEHSGIFGNLYSWFLQWWYKIPVYNSCGLIIEDADSVFLLTMQNGKVIKRKYTGNNEKILFIEYDRDENFHRKLIQAYKLVTNQPYTGVDYIFHDLGKERITSSSELVTFLLISCGVLPDISWRDITITELLRVLGPKLFAL